MAHPQRAAEALRGRKGAATLALVVLCAGIAAAARVPAMGWSLRPDESGFTMVARSWDPRPDSPYGAYWVDRPPVLIGLVRAADAVGGPFALRWLAVAGVAVFVLAAAGTALEVSRARPGSSEGPARAVALTAVGAAALVSNPSIDLVSAKGEVLAVPVLMTGLWLVLRAVRRRSIVLAAVGGAAGGVALGLKQNLGAVLVFGVVLLAAVAVRSPGQRNASLRLGSAFAVGASLPVLATLGWALAEGVRPAAVWEAVYGFRAEATAVIAAAPLWSTAAHALDLVGVLVSSFAALLLLGFVLSLRRLVRERPEATVAAVAVLAGDTVGLVLGGSFWRPYLFALVPGTVLALALLAASGDAAAAHSRSRTVTTTLVAALVLGSGVSAVRWAGTWPGPDFRATAVLLGRAIGQASRPGDTLTVFGGRADAQLASGLASPYPYLWSLPARARDPGSARLASLLRGPDAPTWFLVWTPTDAWEDGSAETLAPVLAARYVRVGTACGGRALHRLRDVERPRPALTCAQLRPGPQGADSDP